MRKDFTIVKNAGSLVIGQVITGLLSLLYIVIVPRKLGPELVGQYTFALSLTLLVSIFSRLGMETFLVKELARYPHKTGTYIGAALIARLLLIAPGLLGIYLFVTLAQYSAPLKLIFGLVSIEMVIGLLSEAIRPAFQALEKMKYNATADVWRSFLTTGLGIAAVELGFGLPGIAIVAAMVAAVVFALQLRWLATLQIRLQHTLDIVLLKHLIRSSLPFWITSMFLTIYMYIDSFLLGVMTTAQVVGWYSAPTKLFATLLCVPVILTTAVFPALSRSFLGDVARLQVLSRRLVCLLLTLSAPMALGLIILAAPLLNLLYGKEFQPSVPVFAILAVSLIPTYINIFANQLLVAVDRQIQWTKVMAAVTIINPLLNIVLIRVTQQGYGNGAIGAAISLLITEILMTGAAFRLLPADLLERHTLTTATKALLCAAVMGTVIWPLRHFFVLIPLGVGMLTYSACGLLIRLWTVQELAELKAMIQVVVEKIGGKWIQVQKAQV